MVSVPRRVADAVGRSSDGRAWLAGLPALVADLRERWRLRLEPPYEGGTVAWVAPATRADGTPAVLKVSWPHREARGEATALEFWGGRGAVLLYEADPARQAMLIERCVPGTPLTCADLSAEGRLLAGSAVLRALWERPAPGGITEMLGVSVGSRKIERLADVTAEWAGVVERRVAAHRPPFDRGLVALGVDLLRTLPVSAGRSVVVHGDVNPGNVLAAARAPWLAIDAKPMLGDPAYDPCPLLLQVDPEPKLLQSRYRLVADAVGEPVERLLAWSAARCVEWALWYVDRGDLAAGRESMADAGLLADLAGL